MTEIPEGMKALRDELLPLLPGLGPVKMRSARALLAPDGPLWPFLRALNEVTSKISDQRWHLKKLGLNDMQIDACLATAEVKP